MGVSHITRGIRISDLNSGKVFRTVNEKGTHRIGLWFPFAAIQWHHAYKNDVYYAIKSKESLTVIGISRH